MSVEMGAGEVLFNKLLTPHWVEAVGSEVAVSINLSHGGLALRGRMASNEVELMQHNAADGEPPVGSKPAWSGLPGQHVPKFGDQVLSRI